MSIRSAYIPTESQIYVARRCSGFCADPGRFLWGEFEELRADSYKFFDTRQRHFERAQADNLAMIAGRLYDQISGVFPSQADIARGNICPLERVMRITQISLTATTAVGAVGVVAGSVTAMPPVIGLSAVLIAGSALGMHAAGEAASLSTRVEDEEERRRQIETLSIENTTLRETGEGLRRQLVELTQNIERLRRENTSLEQNIERLQGGILQFSVQNEHYRRIGEQFSLYLEAFRAGSVEGRELLTAKIAEFTGQLTASRELWDRVSRDTAIFREGYDRQIAQLSSLILQLTDPRHTLARLEEHRAIEEQISRASSTLGSYQRDLARIVEDLARKEGEIGARDQLLRELELAHRQILAEYGAQNAAQGTRNAELSQIVQRISSLVNQTLTGTRQGCLQLL